MRAANIRGAGVPLPAVVVLVCLAILSGCQAPPCTRGETKDLASLTPDQARQDVACAQRAVKALHVDPWHTVSEAAFDAKAQEIRDGFAERERVSRKMLALRLAGLTALIGDGHTWVGAKAPFMDHLRDGGAMIPLEVRCSDAGELVVEDQGDALEAKGVRPGHVLLAIDGQRVEDLLAEARRYVPGESEPIRNRAAALFFPALVWYLHGPKERFRLRLRSRHGAGTYEVSAEAIQPALDPDSEEEPFGYRFYRDGRVCVLRADSFDGELRRRWNRLLDEVFTAMDDRGTGMLIVDVRENGGGHSALGRRLVRRIADEPVRRGTKYVWRWMVPFAESWHAFQSLIIPLFPHLKPWDGRVIVAVGRETFSAAVDFATLIADNELGLIVGRETGGRASYYSDRNKVSLPNSGLKISAATAYWLRPAGYDNGRGVMPDHELPYGLSEKELVDRVLSLLQEREQTH